MDLPQRKPNRLPRFDYNTPGTYFITICTDGKRCILGNRVGGGALDAPQIRLSPLGKFVEKYILSSTRKPNVHIDKYVIMPNHIHLLVSIDMAEYNGPSKAPAPTNAVIPHLVSTLKRFCHRDAGIKIFQRSYHDHIIRNEQDYLKIWEYIDNNPAKWEKIVFMRKIFNKIFRAVEGAGPYILGVYYES